MKCLGILSLLMANQSKHSRSNRDSSRAGKAGSKQRKPVGQIRIVAGNWRGRKIPVVEADGLRPTGDRVRETLFNWLQLAIPGSRCLDLYAGTGALGLEAASRGAASVTLVEASPQVASQLRQTLTELDAGSKVELHSATAEQYLATNPGLFDVVFVDPPFDLQVHRRILGALTPACLAPRALLYVELPTSQKALIDHLPISLERVKQKRFGDVTVFLMRFHDENRDSTSIAS